MKNVLIISFSNLASDPRVSRQINWLNSTYQLITVGFDSPFLLSQQHIKVNIKRPKQLIEKILAFLPIKFRPDKYLQIKFRPDKYYWSQSEIKRVYTELQAGDLDICLIVANDIDTLPLALRFARDKNAKLIFDAHEYAPLEFEDRWIFKLVWQDYRTYLCKKYIPEVDGMMTVCQSIADRYEADTGVKPVVITNAPPYQHITPVLLTKEHHLIKLVHHGAAAPSRKIENMIYMMEYLDNRFELNLILVGNAFRYIKFLRKIGSKYQNVNFLDPVPMPDLPKFLNQFDVGLAIIPPTNFNYRFCLPNKFFEFIQARLAILSGPSIEMVRYIRQYDLGLVANDFTPKALAEKLLSLDIDQINYYKQKSHVAAYELSAEKNQQVFLDLIKEVLEK
ncbi:MAG: hypothetical protein ACK4QL_09295 [Pseudanabaenaceae cyanobacterium]